MKKSLRKQCYITIENNKIIGSQLFNIAYLINILKTKNNEHIKRKIVFNKDNKLYYDTLFKGLFNILDNEKYDSIKFKIVDTADILNDDNDDAANNIKICKESLDKLYTFKDIDDELRKKIIELVYSNEDLMYSAYYKYRDVLNHFGNNTTDNDVAVIHFMKNPDVDYYNNALSFLRDAYKVTNIAVITDDINWAKIALNDINENACFSFYYITNDEIYSYETNFILMSMFKNFIVSDIKLYSTDSLWASYISYYDNKKIIISSTISDFLNIHKYITDII